MKVKVNNENCIACGYCVGVCDEVFEFIENDEGTVSHVKVEEVPENLENSVKDAIESCPTSAISKENE